MSIYIPLVYFTTYQDEKLLGAVRELAIDEGLSVYCISEWGIKYLLNKYNQKTKK